MNMIHTLCLIALFGLLAQTGWAQKARVMLAVDDRAESDKFTKLTKTTRKVETERSVELTIDLRSQDNRPLDLEVDWYFIANPYEHGADNFVYDQGKQAAQLPPNSVTSLVVKSKGVEASVKSSRRTFEREGAKPLGYIVLVKHTNEVAAVATSPSSLQRVALDPVALQKLIVTPAVKD